MLGMLGLLTLVLIATRFAGQPSSWYWLTGRPDSAATGTEGGDAVRGREIDFGVRDDVTLKDGEFLSPGPRVPEPNASETPKLEGPDTKQKSPSANTSATGDKYYVDLESDILEGVQDNTLRIRAKEEDVYYFVLAKARDIPLSYLERAAVKDVAFTVLMLESDRYRGKLITVDGEIRRLVKFAASKNVYGIQHLYEAWLFTGNSGQNPYRIVFTSIPEGIPQGSELKRPPRVRVTGYFFKRYGYQAQHGLHVAPLLLAKQPRWFPPRRVETQDLGLAPYVLGFVVVVGAVLGLTLWRFSISDKKFHQSHLQRITRASNEAIAALDGVETSDVNDLFRQMSAPPEIADAADQPSLHATDSPTDADPGEDRG